MDETTGILPGLPAIAGKPVRVGFDGGQLTSDAGILLLAAIEQRLKIAERLAACIEDPRDPNRVLHGLTEMIRYRALLIAAGNCYDNAMVQTYLKTPNPSCDGAPSSTLAPRPNMPLLRTSTASTTLCGTIQRSNS